jgi:hypothetical protein
MAPIAACTTDKPRSTGAPLHDAYAKGGGGVAGDLTPVVVPAKAGTHNPGSLLLHEVSHSGF